MGFAWDLNEAHILDLDIGMESEEEYPFIERMRAESQPLRARDCSRGASSANVRARSYRCMVNADYVLYLIIWVAPIITALLWTIYSHGPMFLVDSRDIGYRVVVGVTLGSGGNLLGWTINKAVETYLCKLRHSETMMLGAIVSWIWMTTMLLVMDIGAQRLKIKNLIDPMM